ncbi:hypothetical protein Peur_049631 [Populus x canadensis]
MPLHGSSESGLAKQRLAYIGRNEFFPFGKRRGKSERPSCWVLKSSSRKAHMGW